MKNRRVEMTAREKNPKWCLPRRYAIIVPIFDNDDATHHILRKYTVRYELNKLQGNINRFMYIEYIELFAKDGNELKTLILQ